jgi:hypothetical protein
MSEPRHPKTIRKPIAKMAMSLPPATKDADPTGKTAGQQVAVAPVGATIAAPEHLR